jgi:hypothetical protein
VKYTSLLQFPLLILALLLASCRGEHAYKNMKEGEIYYNISYVSNPSTFSSDFLPKELVIVFRDDMVSTNLRSPIGNAGITTVVNPGENIYDTYLSIFSLRYCFEGNYGDMQPGFSSMNGITVHETGRKSVICGFDCRQARIDFPGSTPSHYVWYTDEIKASDPNRMTPFKDIDGVLMDFFYIIGDAELQFTADEVLVKQIPDKEFERRKNYRKVTSSHLEMLILKMMSF